MLQFSEQEYTDRKERLLTEMNRAGLDAMLIFAQESMYWLTGYDTFGFCFFQCLVVKADGETVLMTRSADFLQARYTSNVENIVVWVDGAHARPVTELRELINDMGLLGTTIGVEYDTHGLTGGYALKLEDRLESFATIEDASKLIPTLRLIKTNDEIKHIKKAAQYADLAFDAALKLTKGGADEGKILAAMQGAVLEAGGDYPANGFIIGSGADALLCRYKSGRRKLLKNDQLTLEWAGVSAQYHVAMMRTLLVGKPKPEHEALFEAARDALLAVEQSMVPGQTFGDMFRAHAKSLDGAGLSRYRLNACGYTLGARYAPCWMDGEMMISGNETPVAPNMSLFAHMIIMDRDTQMAMCLGQTYLTTEDKPKPLSTHGLEYLVL